MKAVINLAIYQPDEDLAIMSLLIAQHLRSKGYYVDRNSFDNFKRIFNWSWSRNYDRVWILGKQELKQGKILFVTKSGTKETWDIVELLNDDERGVDIRALRQLAKNRVKRSARMHNGFLGSRVLRKKRWAK